MDDAEKLLRSWWQSPLKDGAKCEDALRVVVFLGMILKPANSQGHYHASHPDLLGNQRFAFGAISINCHAFGVPSKAHPRAIQDILQAAKVIQAAQAQKRLEDNEQNQ